MSNELKRAIEEAHRVVIFTGAMFATVLTLFVVPAAYAVIARNTKSPGHVAKKLEALRKGGSRARKEEDGAAEPT